MDWTPNKSLPLPNTSTFRRSRAAALASYLLNKSGGETEIARMMIDDIRAALVQGRPQKANEIFSALRHFAGQHPELVQGSAVR